MSASPAERVVDLRRIEAEEQDALEHESQALLDVRKRLQEIAERDLTIATKRTGVDRQEHFGELDRLNAEADRLFADARKRESRVAAVTFRRDAARQARADAEAPLLLTEARVLIGDLVEAVGAVAQKADTYIAARTKLQNALRDGTHQGSVVGVYPRPAGPTELVLRLFEDQRGASHG